LSGVHWTGIDPAGFDGGGRRGCFVVLRLRPDCSALQAHRRGPLEEFFVPTGLRIPSLVELGWDDGWAEALAGSPDPELMAGRVSRIDRGAFTVLTAEGPKRVGADRAQVVAVGDWVTLGETVVSTGLHRLAAILPRRCTFRRAKEGSAVEQVVAANVDTVLVTDALDGLLSIRHLERYLALAWQSGVVPVVVITKADLQTPALVEDHLAAVRAVALGVSVHVVSSITGDGIDQLAPYLAEGKTVTLLGLSGAGKSTLVNLLAGEELLDTGAVSADGHGRHTTTHRQLVVLRGGGVLIDTPGMRALSVRAAAEGVAQAFDDIETLSRACDYSDCSHRAESGCAILAAVASGELSRERLESWRRLRLETGADHQLARLQVEDRKRQKAVAKAERAQSRLTARSVTPPARRSD
jgi:ribosome biogenesis GTPase